MSWEIFRTWLLYGTSDLFWIGMAWILIAALLPWKHAKVNAGILAFLAALYVLCELLRAAFPDNYIASMILLYIGGVSLCLAFGRLIRGGIWILRGSGRKEE